MPDHRFQPRDCLDIQLLESPSAGPAAHHCVLAAEVLDQRRQLPPLEPIRVEADVVPDGRELEDDAAVGQQIRVAYGGHGPVFENLGPTQPFPQQVGQHTLSVVLDLTLDVFRRVDQLTGQRCLILAATPQLIERRRDPRVGLLQRLHADLRRHLHLCAVEHDRPAVALDGPQRRVEVEHTRRDVLDD